MRIVETKRNLIVKKDEALVNSRYQLNELSLKIITLVIAMVNKDNKVSNLYSLSVKDFAGLVGASGKSIYQNLERAGKELMKGIIEIPREDGGFLLINGWVSSFEYIAYEGIIEIELSEKLIPYILDFKQKFLRYDLKNILPLKSGYSIRMYEILKDYYNTKGRYGNKTIEKEISVEELKNILKIPKSYKFNDIKRFVLEKSKQDLLEYTDIIFDYKEIKTGRKVTHLKFTIQANPKKLQNQEKEYLKSFKHFVSFIRNNYKANMKYFVGWNGIYFGINKEGLVYSNKKDLDPQKSEKVFKQAYKFAKNSAIYQSILEDSLDFQDDLEADPNLLQLFKEEIKMTKPLY